LIDKIYRRRTDAILVPHIYNHWLTDSLYGYGPILDRTVDSVAVICKLVWMVFR